MDARKPSLYSAAAEVERMMLTIDNAENLDDQIVQDFKELQADSRNAVDRCLYRLAALSNYIKVAEDDCDRAKKRLEHFKSAQESLERYVLGVAKSVSFPLRGGAGEFKIKESDGGVELGFDVFSKSYSNIIGAGVDVTRIDQRFIEFIPAFMRIRKDELRSALLKGEKFSFATLEQKEKVEWKKSMKNLLS